MNRAILIERSERLIGILLTLISVFFVLSRVHYAGALWRDEAGALRMALMPSVSDIAGNFEHEAFPLLFPLTVRSYVDLAGGSDFALRVFGAIVGCAVIGSLWLNSHLLRTKAPIMSLALLGLNPSFIQWTTSVRGYGLGVLLILVSFGLIWKAATTETSIVIIFLAALASVSSVQLVFGNAPFVFAIIVAGAMVALQTGHRHRSIILLAIGLSAALSLLPYLHGIRRQESWNNVVTHAGFHLSAFWKKLSETLSSARNGVRWIWVGIFAAVGLATLWSRKRSRPNEGYPPVQLYAVVVFFVGLFGYFTFLFILRYSPQPWYYLGLMGISAVALDSASFALASWVSSVRAARLCLSLGIVLWSVVPASKAVQVRQTNIDMIAATLTHAASEGDVVIVCPWYLGVSFDRYYKGPATWTTLPPIKDHSMHRYDLVEERMASANPIDSVLTQMRAALASGRHVWFVGDLRFPPKGMPPRTLAPAPHDAVGWNEGAYTQSWSNQVGYFIETHELRTETSPLQGGISQRINPYENLTLVRVDPLDSKSP